MAERGLSGDLLISSCTSDEIALKISSLGAFSNIGLGKVTIDNLFLIGSGKPFVIGVCQK